MQNRELLRSKTAMA